MIGFHKKRKCKICGEIFIPKQFLQGFCSPDCGYKYAIVLKQNKEKKDWKVKKEEMKEKLMSHSDHLSLLQNVFNTWIRLRDKDKPCISCDCDMTGRKGDASHFYSVGGNANLRFNEMNTHLSCVPCNQFKHGNLLEYAERLPIRIGIENFEKLKQERNIVQKYSIEEIKDLIKLYKKKIAELK